MTNRSVIMPKTSQTQKDLRRQTILASAKRLLVKNGFSSISMDEVASSAGTAKGTLFLYFKNKDALILAVYENLFACLGEKLRVLPDEIENPLQLLKTAVAVIMRHLTDNRDFTAILTTGKYATLRRHENIRARIQANRTQIIKILKNCADKGLLELHDPEYEAATLFGMCRSGAMMLMSKKNVSMDDCVEKTVNIFLKGTGKHA